MRKIDRDDPRKRAIRAERKGESKSVFRRGWKNTLCFSSREYSVYQRSFFYLAEKVVVCVPQRPEKFLESRSTG